MSNSNDDTKPLTASHSLVEPPPSTSGGADSSDVRSKVGSKLSSITDFVNDNLIIIRYATFSTVFIIGAYGIANTPLFYRYKNLNDIPVLKRGQRADFGCQRSYVVVFILLIISTCFDLGRLENDRGANHAFGTNWRKDMGNKMD